MAVVEYVVGASGSGKSYVRGPMTLLDYWFPSTQRKVWTNLPFDLAEVSKEYERHSDWTDRLQLIPQEELDSWRTYERGPWDFFTGERGQNYHLIVDECQNWFADQPTNSVFREAHAAYLSKLQQWLGEHLRKNNASAEFISQSTGQICDVIRGISGVRRQMIPAEEVTLWGFRLADVAGLYSKWKGTKQGVVCELVETRTGSGAGETAWKRSRRNIFWLSVDNWKYYKSYNRPGSSDGSGVLPDRQEWEILTWPRYFLTLFSRYYLTLMKYVMLAGAGIAMLWSFYGIITHAIHFAGKPSPKKPTLAQDGQPVALATVEDKVLEEKLRQAGLPKTQANRLEWPKQARDVAAKLEAELLSNNQRISVITAERDQARTSARQLFDRLQKQSQIVAVTEQGAVQRDGTLLKIGTKVTGGLFDGETVEKIVGDSVHFVSGLRVRPVLSTGKEGMEYTLSGKALGTSFTSASSALGTATPASSPTVGSLTSGGLAIPQGSDSAGSRLRPDRVFSGGGEPRGILPLSGTQLPDLGRRAGGAGNLGSGRGIPGTATGSPHRLEPSPEPDTRPRRRSTIQPEPTLAD